MSEEFVHSVHVNRSLCQTAAVCLAFHIYELDDEAKAVLLTKNGLNSDDPSNLLANAEGEVLVNDLKETDGKTFEEMQALVLESAKLCPFNAIVVKDKEGKQIWPLEHL